MAHLKTSTPGILIYFLNISRSTTRIFHRCSSRESYFSAPICVCNIKSGGAAKRKDDWVVVSNIFYFHPYLRKIPILTNIFQVGWFNHQLGANWCQIYRQETGHRTWGFLASFDAIDFWGRTTLSSDSKNLRFFRVLFGDEILPSYVGIFFNKPL